MLSHMDEITEAQHTLMFVVLFNYGIEILLYLEDYNLINC
jgi:hypothetical protein